MRVLKLTIFVEYGMSLASLANTFGDYVLLGKDCCFAEFTFPSVNMLSVRQIEPIHDLIKSTFERNEPLRYKMFYLYDSMNNTYSPISIHCHKGKWFTVSASTGVEMNYSNSLFGLF